MNYAFILVALLGADPQLQADKDWFLGRTYYEVQTRANLSPEYYLRMKDRINNMPDQDARAYLNAYHMRHDGERERNLAAQRSLTEMRIQQTLPQYAPPTVPFRYNLPNDPYWKPYYSPYIQPYYGYYYPYPRY